MGFKTGIHRLAQVAKWFGRLFAAGSCVAGFVAALDGRSEKLEAIGIGLLIALLFLAAFETVAWVLEGFAKE